MTATPITFHTTDDDSPGGGTIRRTLRNWQNRVTSGGLVVAADDDVSDGGATPYEMPTPIGVKRFRYVRNAAFTFFGGEVDDAANTTLMGFHVSDQPDKALFMRARGVTAAAWEKVPGEKTLRWPGIKTDTDLYATHSANGIKTACRLATSSAPAVWEWDVALPDTATVAESAEGWTLTQGQRAITLRRAIAWDATVGGLKAQIGFDGDANVPVVSELTLDNQPGDGMRYLRIRFTADTTGATFPVILDPTANITGTGDIEDNLLFNVSGTFNYGGLSDRAFQPGQVGGQTRRMIVRVATSAIPAGTISGATFFLNREAYASQTQTGTLSCYSIKAANTAWVEGTGTGQVQTGKSCWDQHTAGSQNWAGSAGCGTSGTDYDAVAIGSQAYGLYTAGPDVEFSVALDGATFQAWKAGTKTNAGMLWKTGEVSNDLMWGDTSEGADPLYFTVDYTPATGKRGSNRAMERTLNRGFSG